MMNKSVVSQLILSIFMLSLFSYDNFPQDTYNTVDEVTGKVLLVGYAENPPWVFSSGEGIEGIEAEIIESFAASINAEVKWVRQNEHELMRELEHRNLHIIVSGLTTKSPWKSKVPISKSYLTYKGKDRVIAVPPGEHQLLFQLEEFLNQNQEEIRKLLLKHTEE